MRIPKSVLAIVACGSISACTTSSDGGSTGLTAEEQAIVGVWVGEVSPAEVTLTIKSDKTFTNVTTYSGKTLATREGTWRVEGTYAINESTKCQLADNTGTLQPMACAIPIDTAVINISGNKWTMSSKSTNNVSVVFTKQ